MKEPQSKPLCTQTEVQDLYPFFKFKRVSSQGLNTRRGYKRGISFFPDFLFFKARSKHFICLNLTQGFYQQSTYCLLDGGQFGIFYFGHGFRRTLINSVWKAFNNRNRYICLK